MLNAWFQDRTDLWRHLCEQVVVCSKRTQVHTLADGGRQRLDLIEAAVELIQSVSLQKKTCMWNAKLLTVIQTQQLPTDAIYECVI